MKQAKKIIKDIINDKLLWNKEEEEVLKYSLKCIKFKEKFDKNNKVYKKPTGNKNDIIIGA